MENNLSQIEEEERRIGGLNQARRADKTAEAADEPVEKVKPILSFWQKLSRHWLILVAALFFDLLGAIPFIGVVFNFLFGLVLYLYFGPKKIWTGVALPAIIGSMLDLFLSIMPVNIGAAVIRIALADNR